MKILAMDLGKNKTVVCIYDQTSGKHKYQTVMTCPQQLHDLLVEHKPERVVFEICSAAGWVFDIVRCLGIEIQVANTNGQAWRWKNIRRKNDREDALKLAQLSAMNQLRTVHIPNRQVRQKRALIQYRQSLVARCVQAKNSIHSILDKEGLTMASGKSGWTKGSIEELKAMTLPMENCDGGGGGGSGGGSSGGRRGGGGGGGILSTGDTVAFVAAAGGGSGSGSCPDASERRADSACADFYTSYVAPT